MKIGVIGVGGVGGYFGGLLARSGLDIHFVARGKHLLALQEEGLQVRSPLGDFHVMIHATSEPHEIGPVDLLLLCVKSYDTLDAIRLTEPMVEQETAIVTLQNGIDNIDKLTAHYGHERVLGGTAYIESAIASPGVIAHTGDMARIIFGELSGEITPRARTIRDLFRQAAIDAELSSDIQRVLWEKFLFICGVHGVTTLCRAPLGLVLSCRETRALLVGVMREVDALARKKGIALLPAAVDEALALTASYKKKFKCSMLRDLEWKRPLEIDALNGMVVAMGLSLEVPTPYNETIYACIKLENMKILDALWVSQLED
jgi:2-dehydropantoate 2-reductase